ncbi:hypothetical protein MGAST_12690 [Mycobacterium gastri 'Wayne']|nr:hypothetical protein MGAST_12690 [Mycobacterium gastri 'Wayne']
MAIGVVAGGVAGAKGSVAAWIVPSDNDCAPAAAGAPVIMPVVNDWLRDCDDKGAAAAADTPVAGAEAAGMEGLPMLNAGAPSGDCGERAIGAEGAPGTPCGPP